MSHQMKVIPRSVLMSPNTQQNKSYLLKPNQVPVHEFIKLKNMHDDRLRKQTRVGETDLISKKRCIDLISQQYICDNTDDRLIILNLNAGKTTGEPTRDSISTLNEEKLRQKMSSGLSSDFQFVKGSYESTEANTTSQEIINKYVISSETQARAQPASPKFTRLRSMRKESQRKVHWDSQGFQIEDFHLQKPDPGTQQPIIKPQRNLALIQNRLCRRLASQKIRKPLDPAKHLAFKDDFQANSKNSTLINQYLQSGLGKQHSLLSNYNSLKYCKNSPYGVEVRVLSADPITNRINLSHSEQRTRLLEGLKAKLIPSRFTPDRNLYRSNNNFIDPTLNQQTVSLSESLKEFLSESTEKKRVKENPYFDSSGSYVPLNDTQFDRWFFDRISNMKSYTACKDEQVKEFRQYLRDSRSMSRKNRKTDKRDSIFQQIKSLK